MHEHALCLRPRVSMHRRVVSDRAPLLISRQVGLKEAQLQAAQAQAALRTAQEAEGRAKEREERASGLLAAEGAQVKRLTAERDALARKIARMPHGGRDEATRTAIGGGGGGSDAELVLETFRRKVKCSLCMVNDKDAIINKCFHAFCRDCIQKRLDVRNRKCPACAIQFDYQSVKDLFLTN